MQLTRACWVGRHPPRCLLPSAPPMVLGRCRLPLQAFGEHFQSPAFAGRQFPGPAGPVCISQALCGMLSGSSPICLALCSRLWVSCAQAPVALAPTLTWCWVGRSGSTQKPLGPDCDLFRPCPCGIDPGNGPLHCPFLPWEPWGGGRGVCMRAPGALMVGWGSVKVYSQAPSSITLATDVAGRCWLQAVGGLGPGSMCIYMCVCSPEQLTETCYLAFYAK